METIDLVIKINEEDFEIMKHNIVVNNPLCPLSQEEMVSKIANGIPLPKRHGNLKDADNLKHAFVMWSMAVQGNFSDADIASIIRNSPTIVEADKAESEYKE